MGEKIQAVIGRIRTAGSALVDGIGQGGKTTVEAARQNAGLQLGLLASFGSAVEDQWKMAATIRDGSEVLQSQRKFAETMHEGTMKYFDGLREAGMGAQAGWMAAANTVAAGFGLKKQGH